MSSTNSPSIGIPRLVGGFDLGGTKHLGLLGIRCCVHLDPLASGVLDVTTIVEFSLDCLLPFVAAETHLHIGNQSVIGCFGDTVGNDGIATTLPLAGTFDPLTVQVVGVTTLRQLLCGSFKMRRATDAMFEISNQTIVGHLRT